MGKERKNIKKIIFKKSMILVLMLLLLSSSLTTIMFVGAVDPGKGKYLTVEIVGDGRVEATKVNSGQFWTFYYADPPQTEKVGAGTVELNAIAATNWEFSHWELDLTGDANPVDYKAVKYGLVRAVFVPITYTITATAGLGGSISPSGLVSVVQGEDQSFAITPDFGYHILDVSVDGSSQGAVENYDFVNVMADHTISADFEINTYTIVATAHAGGSISPSGLVGVEHGSDQTFVFTPQAGYHVSSVVVDGDYVTLVPTTFTAGYLFEYVIQDHTIDVYFSPDGIADIAGGLDVTVFLSSGVSLTFDDVGQGFALGTEIFSAAPGDLVVWGITVEATLQEQVLVGLRYDDTGLTLAEEQNLRMYRSDVDFELYLKCDFNNDGEITGQDVKIISNFVKHLKHQPTGEEIEQYDLTNDGWINEDDIHVVNEMKELVWVDITSHVDTTNNIIFGITDHFSIFRGR